MIIQAQRCQNCKYGVMRPYRNSFFQIDKRKLRSCRAARLRQYRYGLDMPCFVPYKEYDAK